MMDRDPLIASSLDRLVPQSGRGGEWEAVLRDARSMGRFPFRGRRRTLAWALAAALAIAVPVAIGSSIYFRDFPPPSDLPPGVEPVRIGPKHVLTSGEVAGVFWRLVAYRSTKGLCLDVDLAGKVSGSGGGCGFGPFRGAVEMPITRDHLALGIDRTWLVGRVSVKATSVALVLSDGRQIEARTYEAPSALRLSHAFYLAVAPGNLVGPLDSPSIVEVIAKDERGHEIGSAGPDGMP